MKMFSIYDTVAEVFNKPFTEVNNASAIRAFTESLDQVKHKTDYALYRVGEFDEQSGVIKPEETPSKIYTGFDIKEEITELPELLNKQAS